jgi:hypothetical protein
MMSGAAEAHSHHKSRRSMNRSAAIASAKILASRGLTYRRDITAPVVVGRLGVVTADNVPINAGREQFGRLLSRVPKGTNLTISGQANDYYAVMMVDHSLGFIAKDKVQLLDYEITCDTPLTSESGPKGQAMAQAALEYIRVPYLWGGNTKDGIDCSGFVKAVYRTQGIDLPRTAADQAGVGYDVPLRDSSQWRVGDRLYFQCHHGYIDHTAMYIGGGYFIHSQGGTGVTLTKVDHPYYWSHLVAVRRSSELLTDAQSSSVVVSSPDSDSGQSK